MGRAPSGEAARFPDRLFFQGRSIQKRGKEVSSPDTSSGQSAFAGVRKVQKPFMTVKGPV
ncbi:hypothetical protein Cpir12675_004067 [Ceratocystis pirilliformis]|uniref:Uncharacterized protein n=1 Tax=Ceratocystis pirilliformis TaxID=259994 RepID=A0ABR3Z0B6_9PEZI